MSQGKPEPYLEAYLCSHIYLELPILRSLYSTFYVLTFGQKLSIILVHRALWIA